MKLYERDRITIDNGNKDEMFTYESHISLHGSVITENILREDLLLINNETMTTDEHIDIYPYNRNCTINLKEHHIVGNHDHCIHLYVKCNEIYEQESYLTTATVQHAMMIWLHINARQ